MASTTALDLRRGAAIGRAAVLARYATSWIFLIPTLVFFVGWQLYPIFRVLWMSFTDYHFLRNQPAQWVGVLSYAKPFADPLVLTGLVRAATFTVLFLPGMIFVPMLLAILVDRVSHPTLATTYRLILLIPAVIPGPLIFVLWKWLYNFNIGPIDYLLAQIGLVTPQTAPQWLGDPNLVLAAIAMMEVWWGLGYHTMFYLAGLAAIPKELFEAARVDGANEWSLLLHVTLSRLRRILLVLVVLRVGTVVRHATLVIFMLVILVPLAWVLLLSIKSIPDAYRPGFWPENFDFSHYAYVVANIPTLARNMLNSVVVTTSTVVLTTMCAVLGGYALVHLPLKGRAVVLALLVA